MSDRTPKVTKTESDRSDVYQEMQCQRPIPAGEQPPPYPFEVRTVAIRSPMIFGCDLMRTSTGGQARLLSPLRYPGAKRQLIPMFEDLLRRRLVSTFVEPFAGGASVSLHLAANGLADRVVLGEADPLVYHFWQIACFDTDWLVDQVETIEISLDTWDRLRDGGDESPRGQALACLFLNRTSFSGILHPRAGPIGGRAQQSVYDLGCRFPRGELARRLRLVGQLAQAGRIAEVCLGDYESTVTRALQAYGSAGTLVYLDPPFFAKAATLYRKSFDLEDHRRLARYVMGLHEPWVLSYDHHPVIRDLYSVPLVRLPGDPRDEQRPRHHLTTRTLHYTAHSRRGAGDEFLVTNLSNLPELTDTKART
jgi:DNA adenine methylase